jgi:hypothetical protein
MSVIGGLFEESRRRKRKRELTEEVNLIKVHHFHAGVKYHGELSLHNENTLFKNEGQECKPGHVRERVPGGGESEWRRRRVNVYWIYSYANRTMKPGESVLSGGGE